MRSKQKLFCELTKEEVSVYEKALRDTLNRQDEHDLALASAKSKHKLDMQVELQKEQKLRQALDHQPPGEHRQVECEETRDDVRLVMVTRRLDTDPPETIHERPLTIEERQGNLLPMDGGKPKQKREGDSL
jgi:hypothetical protein